MESEGGRGVRRRERSEKEGVNRLQNRALEGGGGRAGRAPRPSFRSTIG